jgi:crotonobetaine/carnitine-CoA ligase
MSEINVSKLKPEGPVSGDTRPEAIASHGEVKPDTAVDHLRRAKARWGSKVAFEFMGEALTFEALDSRSREWANGLKSNGVRQGDTVTVMLDNSIDAILILYAILRLGAVYAPVNTSFKGEFLVHQITDTDSQIIIAEADYAERILALDDRLSMARTLFYRGGIPPETGSRLGMQPLSALDNAIADDPDAEIKPADLAMLIYTSGTTGRSKGCMISHGYILNFSLVVTKSLRLEARDILWSPTPLFHVAGIAACGVAAVTTGATMALYPRFSVSNFWPEIGRTGATVVVLLGSMITLLASAPENDAERRCVGQIRLAMGAPFTEEVSKIWCDRFGVKAAGAPGFGMTEACPMTFQFVGDPAPPGTSGRRYADFDTRIFDEEGNECPPGVAGEIVTRPCRPGIMFDGYWRRPQDTLAVMKNLWFRTGDVGRIDEQGFLSFVDRKKDYLRRGGENISSFEMETVFHLHAAIEDVAVHAVPSQLTEDEVKATVVLMPGASLTEHELCRWVIDRVPYFAVPRYIEFRVDLPRNPVGRVLKYQLRDEGVTQSTWDRQASDIVFAKR